VWVDYKDVSMLRKYMSDRGKIRSRRVTGNCAQHQRGIALAIKTARELVLLPYTQRTVTERPGGRRGSGGREGREGREGRGPGERRGPRSGDSDDAPSATLEGAETAPLDAAEPEDGPSGDSTEAGQTVSDDAPVEEES
jgi:small subunit ribosomal protein S18